VSEFSVPAAVAVPDAANLTDPVWEHAEAAPQMVQFLRPAPSGGSHPGDRVTGAWSEVRCRQFRDEVVALARGLVAAGVEPGMRIGLLSRTRYEWTLVDYAIWAVGAVSVPMYETSSPDQVDWILGDSGAGACVVETGEHARILSGIRDRLPRLRDVWQIDGGDLDTLVARGGTVDPAEVDRRRTALRGVDLATIIYTSGTTGRPKGCALTHHNLCSDVVNAVAALPELFNEDASTLLFLPLAHAFARLIQIGAVQTVTTMAHSGMENLADELQRHRPTFVLSVPRVFEKFYDAAAQKAHGGVRARIFRRAERVAIAYGQALETASGPGWYLRLWRAVLDRLVYRKLRAVFGGRCRYAISGGAPLEARLCHFFRGAGLTILEGYGLTETSAAVTANLPTATRTGTVGRPLPGASLRVDADGEVLVKGDMVFQGYWNATEATGDVLGDDGWFRTGDLGELDEDGYLRITGRKKEIIVTAAGKHVVPGMLEERVRAHPLVSHSVLIGDRRPFVSALITIDPQAWPRWLAQHGRPPATGVGELREDQALRTEVQAAVDEANEAVSHPEAIKKFRILPEDFSETNGTLTPTLKVKRAAVQDRYAQDIAAIYGA
jgi:long-chain acyl-CoA synthetase